MLSSWWVVALLLLPLLVVIALLAMYVHTRRVVQPRVEGIKSEVQQKTVQYLGQGWDNDVHWKVPFRFFAKGELRAGLLVLAVLLGGFAVPLFLILAAHDEALAEEQNRADNVDDAGPQDGGAPDGGPSPEVVETLKRLEVIKQQQAELREKVDQLVSKMGLATPLALRLRDKADESVASGKSDQPICADFACIAPNVGVGTAVVAVAENGARGVRMSQTTPRLSIITGAYEDIFFDHGEEGFGRPKGPNRDKAIQARRDKMRAAIMAFLSEAPKGRPYRRIILLGQHDPSGPDKENEALAWRRAKVVETLIKETPFAKGGGEVRIVAQPNGLLLRALFAQVATHSGDGLGPVNQWTQYHRRFLEAIDTVATEKDVEASIVASPSWFQETVAGPEEKIDQYLLSAGLRKEDLSVLRGLAWEGSAAPAQGYLHGTEHCELVFDGRKRTKAQGVDPWCAGRELPEDGTPGWPRACCGEGSLPDVNFDQWKERLKPFRTVLLVGVSVDNSSPDVKTQAAPPATSSAPPQPTSAP